MTLTPPRRCPYRVGEHVLYNMELVTVSKTDPEIGMVTQINDGQFYTDGIFSLEELYPSTCRNLEISNFVLNEYEPCKAYRFANIPDIRSWSVAMWHRIMKAEEDSDAYETARSKYYFQIRSIRAGLFDIARTTRAGIKLML